jgi:hypothetical protein
MCTQHLYHTHPPMPFPISSPFPLAQLPHPRQHLFCLPVLRFCKRKESDILFL